MSKKEEIIVALKNLAKAVLPEKTDEIGKFMDAKTVDGTIIRYDADVLATGVVVSVITQEGEVLPAPLGSYVLEDGTTFDVVDANGVIDNVVLAEAKEEGEPVEPMTNPTDMEAPAAAATPAAKSIIKSTIEETRFEEAFAKVENERLEFSNQLKSLNDKVENQDKLIKEMFSLIESLGNEDSGAPAEQKKNVFKKKTAKELQASFRAQLYKNTNN